MSTRVRVETVGELTTNLDVLGLLGMRSREGLSCKKPKTLCWLGAGPAAVGGGQEVEKARV